MANLLTAIRLLLVLPVTLGMAQPELINPAILLGLVVIAIATDFFDGKVARALNTASARGQIFDHTTDFLFVTSGLAGAAIAGAINPFLPALIVIAFSQYVLDSHFLYRQKNLHMSLLGRYNGIFYFVPLILIIVSRFEFLAGFSSALTLVIFIVGSGLMLTTILSIIDRAVAPLRAK